MLSLKLFETLNAIGKAVRGSPKPFGGIQVIFSGDFFQLPPVGDYLEPDTQRFCFESAEWNDVFHRSCQIQLIKIFRQTDEIYSTILNQIREGKIKRRSNDLLLEYVGREFDPKLIAEPTKLYPTKNKVEQINVSKMSLLTGEEREYKIKYIITANNGICIKLFLLNFLFIAKTIIAETIRDIKTYIILVRTSEFIIFIIFFL